MIQRIQTIWLLLAATTGFLLTQVPLYTATMAGQVLRKFTATEHLLLFAVAALTGLIALTAIFLFKNRSMQLRLSVIGMLLSIVFIALEVWRVDELQKTNGLLNGSYYWGALLPIVMMIFFFLAARN